VRIWTIALVSKFFSPAYGAEIYNAIDGNRPDAGLPVVEKAALDKLGLELGDVRGRLLAALAESKRQLAELNELTEAQADLEHCLGLALLHMECKCAEFKGLEDTSPCAACEAKKEISNVLGGQ
jgi:hypothetical protein